MAQQIKTTSKKTTGEKMPRLFGIDHIFKKQAGEIDYTFLCIVVLITCVGLIMLLSSSASTSSTLYGNPYNFFVRQLTSVAIGFGGMWVLSRYDYHSYKGYAKYMIIFCVILLALVLTPLGAERNGSRRWLFGVQPSEFMKPTIAIFFAYLVDKKGEIKTIKDCFPYFAWIGIIAVLMLFQPHLSGTIIIAGIGAMVMIAAGAPFKKFAFIGLIVGAVVVFGVYKLSPIRWARITSFVEPFADTQDKGYQIAQAIYAIGSGGLFGLGLGQSVQKYSYLPEPYNDFIFAICCEELGLIGALLIIALFIALIWRGLKIALEAPDTFSTLVAVGITAQVAIQSTLNIGVASSAVPNTGVSLPFFSFGGTAIMVLLWEMGLLLNISRHSTRKGLK